MHLACSGRSSTEPFQPDFYPCVVTFFARKATFSLAWLALRRIFDVSVWQVSSRTTRSEFYVHWALTKDRFHWSNHRWKCCFRIFTYLYCVTYVTVQSKYELVNLFKIKLQGIRKKKTRTFVYRFEDYTLEDSYEKFGDCMLEDYCEKFRSKEIIGNSIRNNRIMFRF